MYVKTSMVKANPENQHFSVLLSKNVWTHLSFELIQLLDNRLAFILIHDGVFFALKQSNDAIRA